MLFFVIYCIKKYRISKKNYVLLSLGFFADVVVSTLIKVVVKGVLALIEIVVVSVGAAVVSLPLSSRSKRM